MAAIAFLWCPPAWPQPHLPFSQSSGLLTTPVSLVSQGDFTPHFTHRSAASSCSPVPHTATFLHPQPYACLPYLAIQPRMPNTLEDLADHTLATKGGQAGRCMRLRVGKFCHLAALPVGNEKSVQSMRDRVSSGSSLTACGMPLLPRKAMGQALFR